MPLQHLPVQTPPPPLPVAPPPEAPKKRRRAPRLLRLLAALCFLTFAVTAFFVGQEVFQKLSADSLAEAVYKVDAAAREAENRVARRAAALFAAETGGAGGAFSFRLPRLYTPLAARAQESQKSEAKGLYDFDFSAVQKGMYPILPVDLSVDDPAALNNTTSFSPDMKAVRRAAQSRPAERITGAPLVLIVHTHATECYAESGAVAYDPANDRTRSTDRTLNTVAVGAELCRALHEYGVPTLHDDTLHDESSYVHAYEYSAATVAEYLADFPSIRYVFDLHRDSIIAENHTKYRPVTLYEGLPCAQIMMLVGTNEKGAPAYPWQDNLTLAVAVSEKLCRIAPGLPRATTLAGASYNQQLARYGLLLEIGSCGNSTDEAKAAARAFAAAFAAVLKGE